ncbi:hypothetical protein HK097_008244 [Rhizophlyctis rosea]|uniref:Uncharacterized protein n=1 Tax=Rhizophlyctis rosea TaxID=64517 RepID=A0AAD5SCR6_9FUNG|nr:hypothetical protein HK097_008244 [Rhizophlyctis rosea]
MGRGHCSAPSCQPIPILAQPDPDHTLVTILSLLPNPRAFFLTCRTFHTLYFSDAARAEWIWNNQNPFLSDPDPDGGQIQYNLWICCPKVKLSLLKKIQLLHPIISGFDVVCAFIMETTYFNGAEHEGTVQATHTCTVSPHHLAEYVVKHFAIREPKLLQHFLDPHYSYHSPSFITSLRKKLQTDTGLLDAIKMASFFKPDPIPSMMRYAGEYDDLETFKIMEDLASSVLVAGFIDIVHVARRGSLTVLRYLLRKPATHLSYSHGLKHYAAIGAFFGGHLDAVKMCNDEGFPLNFAALSYLRSRPPPDGILSSDCIGPLGEWAMPHVGLWPLASLEACSKSDGGLAALREGNGEILATAIEKLQNEDTVLAKVRWIVSNVLNLGDAPGDFDPDRYSSAAFQALLNAVQSNMGKVVSLLITECRATLPLTQPKKTAPCVITTEVRPCDMNSLLWECRANRVLREVHFLRPFCSTDLDTMLKSTLTEAPLYAHHRGPVGPFLEALVELGADVHSVVKGLDLANDLGDEISEDVLTFFKNHNIALTPAQISHHLTNLIAEIAETTDAGREGSWSSWIPIMELLVFDFGARQTTPFLHMAPDWHEDRWALDWAVDGGRMRRHEFRRIVQCEIRAGVVWDEEELEWLRELEQRVGRKALWVWDVLVEEGVVTREDLVSVEG